MSYTTPRHTHTAYTGFADGDALYRHLQYLIGDVVAIDYMSDVDRRFVTGRIVYLKLIGEDLFIGFELFPVCISGSKTISTTNVRVIRPSVKAE